MNKLFKLLAFVSLIFTHTIPTSAQTFDYDGTYLTEDLTQAIAGFHFDKEADRIFVIAQNNSTINPINQSNQMRLSKIQTYISDYIDYNSMTQDDVAVFNERHGIDYAEAFRTSSEILGQSSIDSLPFIFDLQNPGILDMFSFNMVSEGEQGMTPYMVIINQPNLKFNQNIWEVSLFNISTPVLRFEANTDASYIKDDYGIVYQLQTEPPTYIEALNFE